MSNLIIEDLSNEVWKDITIPGMIKRNYMISDKGRVKNKITGKILKPTLCKQNGYLYVTLPTYGRLEDGRCYCRKTYVHKLVMDHFTDDIDKIYDRHYIVNHKDANKLHCEYTNLEWVTYKGNSHHALKMGLLRTGERSTTCKTDDATVRKICELLQDGKNYKEICNIMNLEWNDYTKSLLVRIRTRSEWKEISKDYNFDSKSILRHHDDELIEKICDALDYGLSTGDIFSMYGKNIPYNKFRKVVYNVRNRLTYKDISEKHSWWKSSSTTIDS